MLYFSSIFMTKLHKNQMHQFLWSFLIVFCHNFINFILVSLVSYLMQISAKWDAIIFLVKQFYELATASCRKTGVSVSGLTGVFPGVFGNFPLALKNKFWLLKFTLSISISQTIPLFKKINLWFLSYYNYSKLPTYLLHVDKHKTASSLYVQYSSKYVTAYLYSSVILW